MARHCHETNFVVAAPFTNMLVFFMSGFLKAVNPFLARMPKELHEQYMTDLLTELIERKLAERNNKTDDGVILLKYGFIVAFARKTRKLYPSISSSHL
jgi:hypothetical protein